MPNEDFCWNGGVQVSGGDENLEKFKLDKPWDAMKINEQTPAEAYEAVLAGAGCCKPKRDAVDSRIIEEGSLWQQYSMTCRD